MKKLIAIILTAAMLLSACAFAEGAQITVKNIVIVAEGDMALDLSGFDAKLEFAAEGDALGAHLDFLANGSSMGSVALALIDQVALMQVNGAGTSTYMMDLSGYDLEAILASVMESIPQADESALDEAVIEQLAVLFEGSVTDLGVQVVDGLELNTMQIVISKEQFAALIAAVGAQSGEFDISEVEELLENVSLSAEGIVGIADGLALLDLDINLDGGANGGAGALNLYAVYFEDGGESGDLLSVVISGYQNDALVFGASADFEFGPTDDVSWMQLDAGNAVDITALSENELSETMQKEFENLAAVVSAGAMSVLYANMAAQMAEQAQ